MDNNAAAQSVLDTLRTVEFRLGLKGYNVDEVDEYLEKAAVEAESVKEQLRTVTDRLRHVTERVGELESELQQTSAGRGADRQGADDAPGTPAGDETLQRTLILAQKFVDQIKRECEAEAAQVVAKAEERARAMVAQAEEHARRVSAEADQRLRDEVTRLESERVNLAGEVDAMSKHIEAQRAQMRASLTDALKWFDQHADQAPLASRPVEKRAPDYGAEGPGRDVGTGVGPLGPPLLADPAPPTRPSPATEGMAPQGMPVGGAAPRSDATQALPMTASDRAAASAGSPFDAVGMTGNLFENGHRAE